MKDARTGRGNAPARHFSVKDWQGYLEVPLRRPLFVLVPMVFLLTAMVIASFVLPKKYRSSTLILVESEKVPDAFVPKMATESMGQRLLTIRQEMLSRTRLERVISELDPYPTRSGHAAPLSEQVEQMRRSITIQRKGSDAFVVEYEHTDPRMAMRLADRVAAIFISEAESSRQRQATEGYEFIESQLAQTRKTLETKEGEIRRFKELNTGNLPEQLATNLAALQRLQMEQQTLAENVRGTQTRIDLLRQSLHQDARTAGASDPSAELAQLRSQLVALRARYTNAHPDVQLIRKRIQELEAADSNVGAPEADGSSRSQVRRAEMELDSLKAKRADLEAEKGRIQSRVDRAPRTEQELATLTRDYGQLQESYLSLLKKQMEARMAEQMERRWRGDRFKVLDPANYPERHIFPNRPLFAVLGLFLGLVTGVACAFTAEFLDHSIKSPEELEALFTQPVLASIPDIKAAHLAAFAAR